MESNDDKFKVMLINSVLMTTLIPLYVRYKWYAYSVRWRCHVLETEKILVFHRQPNYRYYYYVSRMLRYQKRRKDFVFYYYFFLISTSSFVLNFVCFREIIIARNRGHFEPANNYQRYIVSHSATIEYQEDSIWRRSGLDLHRSVFRTTTYTIWAPQIFYLMKRKRKEDLQVNLWDFSRQSDDMMSEFWFAFIKFSRQDYWICIQRLVYFYS